MSLNFFEQFKISFKKSIHVRRVQCCPSSNIKREGKKSVEVKTRHFGRLAPLAFFFAAAASPVFENPAPISHSWAKGLKKPRGKRTGREKANKFEARTAAPFPESVM